MLKRADAAIKSLRGSDHKALVTSYSVAQNLAEVIEQLCDLAQRPADCGAAMDFCEWLRGYFAGDWGRDELTPFEANTIRAELGKVFPGPEVTSTNREASDAS